MASGKVKIDDRVKRKKGEGCLGTVKDVRAEVVASGGDSKDKALLVSVKWDNGTFSYFVPEALEVVTSDTPRK
ncbi:hypothetical protein OAO01_08675 [Oligoflexia bacterium]|nr:hypothetical protein [Oligoflexia bacterium]